MIYIHTLEDLNPKSAEIESTYLIRGIKQNTLSEEKLKKQFLLFFVSKTDLDVMSKALELIPATINNIIELLKTNGVYEKVNLQRAYLALQEIPDALKRNIDYAKEIFEWQELFISKITDLLNKITLSKTKDERGEYEKEINFIFEKILRNKENFIFNYKDIINEVQLVRINTITESMSNGFFFHITLGEYLKKEDFITISKRIPPEELEKVNAITKKIMDIKHGVKRAYEHNMRMINLALVFYAYIKWLRGF